MPNCIQNRPLGVWLYAPIIKLQIDLRTYLFTIALLLLVSLHSKGQGSISYYPFNSYLAVSTNPDKTLWFETRVVFNTLTNSLVTEIAPMVTISRSQTATYYLGAGINMYPLKAFDNDNVLNAYFLSAGVRAYPFEKAQRVGINFELSPLAYKKFDLGNFRAFFGLSYRFGDRTFKQNAKNN